MRQTLGSPHPPLVASVNVLWEQQALSAAAVSACDEQVADMRCSRSYAMIGCWELNVGQMPNLGGGGRRPGKGPGTMNRTS